MEKPILGPRIVRPFSARKAVEHFVPGGTFARSGLRRKKPLTTNTTDDNAPQAVDHITLKHSPAAVETGGASSRPVIGRSSSVPLHTGVHEHPGDTARDLARVRPDRERVSTGAKIILSHPAHNPQKPVPKPVEHEMILNEIRASPEYGIAWDLECWRIHETKRIEHELEEKERKQTAELTDRLRRTELEANRARERKRNELREREERLRVQEQTLMRRFEQLDEQERELVHRVVELDAREKRIREDTDAQVRRLKEDIACQAELHNRRLLDAQNTIHTLRNQIARLEVERAALWDSLNEAKMSMTAASNSTPHLSRHVLTANKAENEGTLTISAHYDAMLSRMHSENQKIVGALREEVRTLRAELALQQHCKRKKYVTQPRRGRTGRSVERLAPVQLEGSDPYSGSSDSSEGSTTESEDCNEHSLTARTRQPQRDLPSVSNGKPKARSTRGHKEEVAKLLQTRSELIATKAYSESSEVILMLDQQIQALSKS